MLSQWQASSAAKSRVARTNNQILPTRPAARQKRESQRATLSNGCCLQWRYQRRQIEEQPWQAEAQQKE